MTSMPRTRAEARDGRHKVVLGKGRQSTGLRGWHVACIVLGCSGCPYWGPITLIEVENVPPRILSHTDGSIHCAEEDVPEDGDTDVLCVAFDGQPVFVTATDDDGDTLEFHWEGSASGRIGNAENTQDGDLYTSKVRVDRDTLVDGESLECWVSDGSPDIKRQIWTVVVYE
ncbi:MAG: hypothetical protein JXB39_14575 [Deltaproteobacteria bacterium]|nr:hypothetical protein [Deltaproteobacteria bacterium]